MTTDARNDATPKPRDADFYFSLITFEVENVLFRVPRHPFEIESAVFKGMFTLPSPRDAPADGTSDENPLVLHGITAQDFHALLTVLFDPAYSRQRELTQHEWFTVLHLAHMWNFDRIFDLAIEKLEELSLSPIVRITQAKSYGITKWLRPAYFDLAMRTDPLTLEEAEKLGMDCMVKIVKVRESRYIKDSELQSTPPAPYAPSQTSIFGVPNRAVRAVSELERAVHSVLTEVFGIE